MANSIAGCGYTKLGIPYTTSDLLSANKEEAVLFLLSRLCFSYSHFFRIVGTNASIKKRKMQIYAHSMRRWRFFFWEERACTCTHVSVSPGKSICV